MSRRSAQPVAAAKPPTSRLQAVLAAGLKHLTTDPIMAREGAITPESLEEARKCLRGPIDQIDQIVKYYGVPRERAKYLLKIQQRLMDQLAKMDVEKLQELEFRDILKSRRKSVASDSDTDSDTGVFLGQLAALMQK